MALSLCSVAVLPKAINSVCMAHTFCWISLVPLMAVKALSIVFIFSVFPFEVAVSDDGSGGNDGDEG